MTKYRVSYETPDAFFNHGRQVEEIIEKDTGRPVIQTKSLPPFLIPVELSDSACEELKKIQGVKVEEHNED